MAPALAAASADVVRRELRAARSAAAGRDGAAPTSTVRALAAAVTSPLAAAREPAFVEAIRSLGALAPRVLQGLRPYLGRAIEGAGAGLGLAPALREAGAEQLGATLARRADVSTPETARDGAVADLVDLAPTDVGGGDVGGDASSRPEAQGVRAAAMAPAARASDPASLSRAIARATTAARQVLAASAAITAQSGVRPRSGAVALAAMTRSLPRAAQAALQALASGDTPKAQQLVAQGGTPGLDIEWLASWLGAPAVREAVRQAGTDTPEILAGRSQATHLATDDLGGSTRARRAASGAGVLAPQAGPAAGVSRPGYSDLAEPSVLLDLSRALAEVGFDVEDAATGLAGGVPRGSGKAGHLASSTLGFTPTAVAGGKAVLRALAGGRIGHKGSARVAPIAESGARPSGTGDMGAPGEVVSLTSGGSDNDWFGDVYGSTPGFSGRSLRTAERLSSEVRERAGSSARGSGGGRSHGMPSAGSRASGTGRADLEVVDTTLGPRPAFDSSDAERGSGAPYGARGARGSHAADVARGPTAAARSAQTGAMARVLQVTSAPSGDVLPLIAPAARAVVAAAAAKPTTEPVSAMGGELSGAPDHTLTTAQKRDQEKFRQGKKDQKKINIDVLASRIANAIMGRLKREKERRGIYG